jgi:cytochrome P450
LTFVLTKLNIEEVLGRSAMEFDPFDNEDMSECYEIGRALRTQCPVLRSEKGFVYASRWAECQEIFRDARRFASAGGARAPGVEVPRDQLLPNEMDPPLHPRIRRLLVSAFNPAMVEEVEPFTRRIVRRTLDRVAKSLEVGVCDLVPTATIPIPSAVTVHILGFPEEDSDQVGAWGAQIMDSDWVLFNRNERGEGFDGFPEFRDYINAHVANRRRDPDPPNDLVTRLVKAEFEGERLNDTQIRTVIAFLFLAGVSTTTALMGNLLYQMLLDRRLYQQVIDRPSLAPVAVEESLRYTSPVTFMARTAVAETELAGTPVHPGDRVIIGISSAGRDPDAYGPNADEYRLDRVDPPQHFAFGFGAHYCLGRDLGRMEAAVFLQETAARFPDLALAPGFTFEKLPVPFEWGPVQLQVANNPPRRG